MSVFSADGVIQPWAAPRFEDTSVDIHIWAPEEPTALCGSRHAHRCPESATGHDIAQLDPGSTRCWCGSRVCAACLRIWNVCNERGHW